MDHWLSSAPLPLLPAVPPTLMPEVVRDPATLGLLSKFDLGIALRLEGSPPINCLITITNQRINQAINQLIAQHINHM